MIDADALKLISEYLWAPLLSFLGYHQWRRDKRMDKIEDKSEKNEQDLADYKYQAGTIFATHENLREVKEDTKYVRQRVDEIAKHLMNK